MPGMLLRLELEVPLTWEVWQDDGGEWLAKCDAIQQVTWSESEKGLQQEIDACVREIVEVVASRENLVAWLRSRGIAVTVRVEEESPKGRRRDRGMSLPYVTHRRERVGGAAHA
jgi:hypothetical protein